MSAVKIMRSLLLNNVDLGIPGARIAAGTIPQGTLTPAIGISEITSTDTNIPATLTGGTVQVTSMVQVTVVADDYSTMYNTIRKVRNACRNRYGNIAGYGRVSVQTSSTGPDLSDAEAKFYSQSQDFTIVFAEPIG